jgi:hypothetical protein
MPFRLPPWFRPPSGARVCAWLLLILGVFFLCSTLARATLMLMGDSTRGRVQYSVRAYGMSRGSIYRVHYSFEAEGRPWDGVAQTVSADAPAGPLAIRYLPWLPQLNGPNSQGYLAVGLLARLLAATLLSAAALTLLRPT